MSIEKAAAITETVKASSTTGDSNERSSLHFLLLGTLATLLFALNVTVSVIYYRDTGAFDYRWILAFLDVSLIMAVYGLAGKRISRLLVSMKLALTLLFILAIFSIVGTILPQGETVLQTDWPKNPVYDFYKTIGLFDMYRSRWFMGIMYLLVFNLSMCIYKRLPSAVRKTIRPRVDVNDVFIKKQPLTVAIEGAGERGLRMAKDVFGGRRFRIRTGSTGSFMGERGRFTPVASLAFHMSFLFIGVGAAVMVLFGFDRSLEVPDGRTVAVPETDLRVKNYEFNVEYIEVREGDRVTGYRPSVFSSDLEVFRGEESLGRKTITVNSPLRIEGVNFHQSSYYRTNRGYVTVLGVTHSPGKSLIYIGFFLMMGGISFAIYFPHRRIWAKMSESGDLLIGGRTNRSKVAFQRDFERIISELRLTLGQEARSDGLG